MLNERLPAYGIDASMTVLRDGSGISPINLVSANQFTLFLTNIQKEKWFNTYVHALPLAGASERMVGGTLRNRLKEPATLEKVRAKQVHYQRSAHYLDILKRRVEKRLLFPSY